MFYPILNPGSDRFSDRIELINDSSLINDQRINLVQEENGMKSNLSGLFGVKDLTKLLASQKKKNGMLLPLLRKFIFKLKKFSKMNKFENLSHQNLELINDKSYFKEEKVLKKTEKISLILSYIYSIGNLIYKIPIIHPQDTFKTIWDIMNYIIILLLLFWIPIDICFRSDLPTVIQFFIIFFFLIDVLLNLNTAYFEKGVIVTKRSNIFKKYLNSFFFIDLITSIIYLITLLISVKEDLNYLELIKLIFFLKLITLNDINDKLIEKFKLNLKLNSNVFDLFYMLFGCLVILHLFACFWNFVGEVNLNHDNITTWLNANDVVDESFSTKYLMALYWSAVTMMTVGYGDITAHNNLEYAFSVFAILVGCGVFAYFISTISIVIGDINKASMLFKNNLNIINKYMDRKKITYNLQMKIREYLRFIWKEEFTQNAKEEEKIINKLSKSLKEELYLEANGKFLNKFPMFFANFSELFLRELMYKMKEVRHIPEEVIFSEGIKDNNAIYFIIKGKVEIYVNKSKNHRNKIKLKEIGKGDSFGELSFFTGSLRIASAKSKDFTTLFEIKRDEFLDLISNFNEDYEKFCMIKDQIKLYSNFDSLKIKCFSCDQIGHYANNCPLIHPQKKSEKVINEYLRDPGQDRITNILRKPKKKLNSRFNHNEIKKAHNRFQFLLYKLYDIHNELEDLVLSEEFDDSEIEKKSSKLEKTPSKKDVKIIDKVSNQSEEKKNEKRKSFKELRVKTKYEKLKSSKNNFRKFSDDYSSFNIQLPNIKMSSSLASIPEKILSATPTPIINKDDKNINDNGTSQKLYEKSALVKLPIYNFENKDKIETKENFQSDYIESIKNFRNYFPNNNIKFLLKKKPLIEDNNRFFRTGFIKKNINKSHFTKTRIYPNEEQIESPKSSPKADKNGIDLMKNNKFENDGKINNKRISNIFHFNSGNFRYFEHKSGKSNFYDIVYEVLTNEELRKKLQLEKINSKKKKMKIFF